MEIFILNYKDEVKRLISENYEPADSLSKEFKKTTQALTYEFMNVIPNNAIDEHLVYEALRELGFEPKEEKPLVYFWYFKRKNNI
ncbi:hypothetical protein H8R23_04920 [Flavobacterium sp. F-380]|uniref:Uncharacterized protein n=1 Tax=Flavobacterium kayseriense TaxID=2764714 RepID=A0ABR7J5E5_9FLAO|nr:hypothetical protein [Flavobacterium kayseriense]MBC5840739.1 hypothetical protein [Flavobacterium kayseriense]MBC5846591.1 hypothetical protein [Flavobacterium kayseriense]